MRFEASVAGGIPVLAPLASDLAANDVTRIRGIVNGTTNYILTAMAQEGRSYGDILADAQELGYAEADPSGDVEGDDAVNKLVILARLGFDVWLDPASVARRPPTVRGTGAAGITGVTDLEIEGAAALGLTLKLLATVSRDGWIDHRRRPADRRAVRQPVRLDRRGHQPRRDRRPAARDRPAGGTGCGRRRHQQCGPRRPPGDRPGRVVHLGRAPAGRAVRRPKRRRHWTAPVTGTRSSRPSGPASRRSPPPWMTRRR